MKKNKKSKWILLLACLASIFTLAGCKIGNSLENVKEENNLKAQVTYYSNGGTFEGTPDRKDMYYQEGATALNIGVVNPTNGTATVSRNNYEFDGWYYAVLDEDNNPVFEDEEKGIYKLGEKVDFSKPLEAGDHWQLVAKWSMKVVLNVKLVLEDTSMQIPVDVKEGEAAKSYKHGDIVQTRQYDTADKIVNPKDGTEPFVKKSDEVTFVEYYMDEACTELVSWPLVKGENQTEDAVIYAKYITGNWKVIRNTLDVNNMFELFENGGKIYLAKDIDASKITYSPNPNALFNAEIQGNGYEIKNLKVKRENLKAGSSISLFGSITKDGKIENLTLSNMTIEYKAIGSIQAYYAFTSIDLVNGAKINNVKLSGKMTVGKPSSAIVTSGLFGGYETDEAYLQATENKGFTVEGSADTVIEIK